MDLNLIFRRLVFAQVLLGIVAFCLADQNPELLLVAGVLAALSWYVVEGSSGRTLPKKFTLIGSLGILGWLLFEVFAVTSDDNPVRRLGRFAIWLQVLQLYTRKTNREYVLLLVLSFLQMVGAMVLTQTIFFATLFLGYGGVSLFTVLVFAFKATRDRVWSQTLQHAPLHATVQPADPIIGRGFSWQFRLISLLIAFICMFAGGIVFFMVPRVGAVGWPGSGYTRSRVAAFSSTMQLNGGTIDINNPEEVLRLTLHLPDPLKNLLGKSWYLRGAVLDTYVPSARTWVRDLTLAPLDVPLELTENQKTLALPVSSSSSSSNRVKAHVTLYQHRFSELFTIQSPLHIQSDALQMVLFNPADQLLFIHRRGLGIGPLEYDFEFLPEPSPEVYQQYFVSTFPGHFSPKDSSQDATFLPVESSFNQARLTSLWPENTQYARGWKADLTSLRTLATHILQQSGLTRDPQAVSTPNDEQIAQALTDHLQHRFTYSLTAASAPPGQDPITCFLFQQKQGHCELFAAGLAGLARSIGLQARVVTGYIANDYNTLGDYYVVRQSDAHAWTEIYCPNKGWKIFDATPASDLPTPSRDQSFLARWLNHAYDYAEYLWNSSVLSYNRQTQKELMNANNHWLSRMVVFAWPNQKINSFKRWASTIGTSKIIDVLALIATVFAILLALWTLFRIWWVRRLRLQSLRLHTLPPSQQRAMARNLAFYLTMLDMLQRHGHLRPSWQSPLAFAQELAAKDDVRFSPVLHLTRLFYEIRFGQMPLNPQRRLGVRMHLRRLEEVLG